MSLSVPLPGSPKEAEEKESLQTRNDKHIKPQKTLKHSNLCILQRHQIGYFS